nr:MAG TPA: hypothetical protein [Caudoviricetes sp.]DAY85865.1 MAG TPA: hypothetical protein [Caudoviricetes sp.]
MKARCASSSVIDPVTFAGNRSLLPDTLQTPR